MNDVTRVSAVAIAAVLLVSTAAVAAFILLAGDGDPPDEDTPAEISRWCDDVRGGIGADQAFRDVETLVEAIDAGELREPDDAPPEGSTEELDRWQERNAEYLTSSYLAQLPTTEAPGEVVLPWATLQLAINYAHDGRPGYDAGALEGVVESLDGFLQARC